jgi:SAM-dependent methyltransferase
VRFLPRRRERQPAPRSSDQPLFDQPFYVDITEARLGHLASLGLPVEGRSVIDVGAGIGRLSEFFAERGCDVLCVDGRPDNIELLRRNYPGRRAEVVDVESDELLAHGRFDVVFCYGLLYHLADPMAFLMRAGSICDELMIVETLITDSEEPVVALVADPDDPTMALRGIASRPSPSYVGLALHAAGFEHLYRPRTLPDHGDFQYEPRGDGRHMRDGNPMRGIFVASRRPLDVPALEPFEPRLRPPEDASA